MKRVLVINPVGHPMWDDADRVLYKGFLPPNIEVNVVSLPRGPATVETAEAYREVVPLVVEVGRKLHVLYDGIVVNCFLDPGVEELRSEVGTVVLGPGETSLTLARLYGRPVYIVTVGATRETLDLVWSRVKKLGFGNVVVDVVGIPAGVLDIDKDKERTVSLLVDAVREVASRDRRAVVVLGCTGLGGLAEDVEKATRIPVIDPVKAVALLLTILLELTKAL